MSGIHLNIDPTDFFYWYYTEPMTKEAVLSYVNQYEGTQVDTILFCLSSMKAAYPSKKHERLWDGFDRNGGREQSFFDGLGDLYADAKEGMYKMYMTFALLEEEGIDPYELWMKRCRQIGISPWISFRMNDVHCVDEPRHPFHTTMWREHPEYKRLPYRFTDWTDRAFDFGRPEVREYRLSMVEEMCELYDFDGFELDWMRFGYHFRPGFEEEGTAILTELTRKVRAILDRAEVRRGHPIALSARVPSRPATSLYLGMDAWSWAKERLIDLLVVTPFWASVENDMPIETWKQLLEGTGVTLAAGLEILLRPYREYRLDGEIPNNTPETTRGSAMSFLQRGADVIYLFNYMDSQVAYFGPKLGLEGYRTLLSETGDISTIRGKPRRHIVTFSDVNAVGALQMDLLPRELSSDDYVSFRVPIGERPCSEQIARVVLSLSENEGSNPADYAVRVNGIPCESDEDYRPVDPCPENCKCWKIPGSALHDGTSVVELTGMNGVAHWLEIAVD